MMRIRLGPSLVESCASELELQLQLQLEVELNLAMFERIARFGSLDLLNLLCATNSRHAPGDK